MELEIETAKGDRRTTTIDAIDGRRSRRGSAAGSSCFPPAWACSSCGIRRLRSGWSMCPVRTLYVRYNVVNEGSSSRSTEIDRRCVHIRWTNSCSTSATTEEARPAAIAISSVPGSSTSTSLSVLIGRLTFSAGSSLAVLLER